MLQANTVEFAYQSCGRGPMSCSICLDDIREGDMCRRLPCMHVFHRMKACDIDAHLVRNKTCPVCKVPIDIASDEVFADVPPSRSLRHTISKLQAGFREFQTVVSSVREMLQALGSVSLQEALLADDQT